MKPLTPMEAQHRLDYARKHGMHMSAEHRRAMETIAGMRTEYRTEEWQGCYPGWVPTSPWTAEKPVEGPDPYTRIVPRYVTEPGEA